MYPQENYFLYVIIQKKYLQNNMCVMTFSRNAIDYVKSYTYCMMVNLCVIHYFIILEHFGQQFNCLKWNFIPNRRVCSHSVSKRKKHYVVCSLQKNQALLDRLWYVLTCTHVFTYRWGWGFNSNSIISRTNTTRKLTF